MEDEILIRCNFEGNADEHIFAVFDGHGGLQCSRFVSANFCTVLSSCKKKQLAIDSSLEIDPARVLTDTFEEISNMCRKHQIPHGSCAIVCYIVGGAVYTACLGDSRAVLGTSLDCAAAAAASATTVSATATAKLMAQVYKPFDESEQSRIKELGGFITPNGRVNGVLAVSRALGDVEFQPFISAEPSIEKHTLHSNDKFIVLACDGVWDVYDDQGCVDLLTGIENPEKASAVLRDSAFNSGSKDNISAIVVRML